MRCAYFRYGPLGAGVSPCRHRAGDSKGWGCFGGPCCLPFRTQGRTPPCDNRHTVPISPVSTTSMGRSVSNPKFLRTRKRAGLGWGGLIADDDPADRLVLGIAWKRRMRVEEAGQHGPPSTPSLRITCAGGRRADPCPVVLPEICAAHIIRRVNLSDSRNKMKGLDLSRARAK